MDGRIVSVNVVEDGEGCRNRQILITIPEPPMPYQPLDYIPDWRMIQKQQQSFNKNDIKEFEEYEVDTKMYDKALSELDAFHIGGVAIIQNSGVK